MRQQLTHGGAGDLCIRCRSKNTFQTRASLRLRSSWSANLSNSHWSAKIGRFMSGTGDSGFHRLKVIKETCFPSLMSVLYISYVLI